MNCICLLTILLGFSEAVSAMPDDAAVDLIQQAIQEYDTAMETSEPVARRERFRRSQILFRKAIDLQKGQGRGAPSALLYVNYGNASLQAEDYGHAIAAYRQAISIDPANSKAKNNLTYVRRLVPDWVRQIESDSPFPSFFFWKRFVSRSTVIMWSSILFLMTVLIWGSSLKFEIPLLRTVAVVPCLCWLVLFFSATLLPSDESSYQAVVVVDETPAMSADSLGARPAFETPLPNGTEVHIVQERDDWLQIEISQGTTAWIMRSAVERLP